MPRRCRLPRVRRAAARRGGGRPTTSRRSPATRLLLRCAACGTARTAGAAASPRPTRRAPTRPGAPRGRARWRRRCCAPSTGGGWRCSAAPRPARCSTSARAAGASSPTRARTGCGRARASSRRRASTRAARRARSRSRTRRSPGLGAITLWHVLEHVEDPARRARARCAAGCARAACCSSACPNLDSLQARARRPALVPPRPAAPPHALHRGGHRDAARAHRLRRSTAIEHRLLEHNPFGLWQSAVNRVTPTPSWLYHALKRNAPLRAADAVPTALALPLRRSPLRRRRRRRRRGGTVAVLARRRTLSAWKASAASSTTQTCSGGWPRWPSRCRARRTSPGRTTPSSSPST